MFCCVYCCQINCLTGTIKLFCIICMLSLCHLFIYVMFCCVYCYQMNFLTGTIKLFCIICMLSLCHLFIYVMYAHLVHQKSFCSQPAEGAVLLVSFI